MWILHLRGSLLMTKEENVVKNISKVIWHEMISPVCPFLNA